MFKRVFLIDMNVSCFYLIERLTLNTRFQSNPPLRSAEAPMYWKVSMLITSMTGQTTLVGSWNSFLFVIFISCENKNKCMSILSSQCNGDISLL